MQLKDVPPGTICYATERIGDDKNRMEVRETYWLRDEDSPCRHAHFVRTARLGCIQGTPGDEDGPRYHRLLREPCRDPGETDGRIQVHLLSAGASMWRLE